jgi:flagellar biosynthesis/type III secretory pathway protein FliH
MSYNKNKSLFNPSAYNADNNKNKKKKKNNKKKNNDKNEPHKYTDWHRGFVGAMKLELGKTGNNFKYISEYQLISHAYYIDLFVIRKRIKKKITTNNNKLLRFIDCFLHFTFCEYKPSNDILTIYDIDRLINLCLQYYIDRNQAIDNQNKENKEKGVFKKTRNISRDEIAAMFVVSHFPRKALKQLPEGWNVVKIEPGVYIITCANILVSIVVINELQEESYNLLTMLKSKLSEERIKKVLKESQRHPNDGLWESLSYVLLEKNVVHKINKGELKMSQGLLEVIKQTPYGAEMLNRYRNEGLTEGLSKGLAEGISKGLSEGISKGKAEGLSEGISKGLSEGLSKGKAEDIIRILTRRLEKPSATLQKQIREVKDINELDELIDFAITCVSLGEFATAFN